MALSKIWPEIMGPRWSKISSPVRFTGGKSGRTLIISAPGPAAALIMAASHQIIERLNAHLGAGHVRYIKLVQSKMTQKVASRPKKGLSPREEERLRRELKDVRSETVKDALETLGRRVLQETEK